MTHEYREPAPPQRAMMISAHPDDIEFVVAGTAAKWRRAGCAVRYVVVTSGDVGSHQPGMTRVELARMREAEQRAAAAVAGVDDVVFLGYPDGTVENSLALRRDLVREIRRFRPDIVFCFDPTMLFGSSGYINHPDHRAVAQAAIDAISPAASMPLIFPELRLQGYEPHRVKAIYIAASENADVWVDITETIELKIQALRKHTSQFTTDWDPADMLREWAAADAAKTGMCYSESFRRFVLVDEEEES